MSNRLFPTLTRKHGHCGAFFTDHSKKRPRFRYMQVRPTRPRRRRAVPLLLQLMYPHWRFLPVCSVEPQIQRHVKWPVRNHCKHEDNTQLGIKQWWSSWRTEGIMIIDNFPDGRGGGDGGGNATFPGRYCNPRKMSFQDTISESVNETIEH